MEAEMIDSQTGRQIVAVVESQIGKRLSLAGISTWGDAKAVMDDWVNRLRKHLDEAHGSGKRSCAYRKLRPAYFTTTYGS